MKKGKIIFEPWIGDNYKKGGFNGKKLLILGESHYGFQDCNDEVRLNGTKDVIRRFLDPKYHSKFRSATLTRITQYCLNQKYLNEDDKNEFWRSIIFYNYLTESLVGPGDRPTKEQWEKSEHAFCEVLDTYTPQYMMVCGRSLWFSISYKRWEDGPYDYYGFFKINNSKKCFSTFIYHPSRFPNGHNGFNPYKIFQKLINYDEHLTQ